MALDVYVNFNGNCREAAEFYAAVFGAETPKIMRFGDAPPSPEFPVSDAIKDLVMHTEVKVKGSTIMLSDVPPGMPFIAGNNISLVLGFDNVDELKGVFGKLKEGGTVTMELQETFWSKCYGYLTDRFGISWQLSLANT